MSIFINAYFSKADSEAEPGLKDKILSFFKGAAADYADVPKLSGAAKKYYRTYKKLFDEFSARNQQNNASENAPLSTLSAENAQKETLTRANDEKAQVSERQYAIVALDNGNMYVTATRKVIKSNTLEGRRKEISHFFDVLLEGQPSIDIHTIEGDVLTITKSDTADKARDNYKTVQSKRVKLSDNEFRVKLNAEAHIDELAEISTPKLKKAPDSKNHSFAKDGFTYRTAYFEDFDGKYYRVTLSIGNSGNIATVYNVGEIKENVPSSAKIIAVMGSKALDETFSDISISQKSEKSNTSGEKSSRKSSDGKQRALNFNDDDGAAKKKPEVKKESKAEDSDKRIVSRGELQKINANYMNDRIYSKKDVTESLKEITEFKYLPDDIQIDLINDIWNGLNSYANRVSRETFVNRAIKKLYNRLEVEAYTEENYNKIKALKAEKRKVYISKDLTADEKKKQFEAIDKKISEIQESRERLLDNIDWNESKKLRDNITITLHKLLDKGAPSVRAKAEQKLNQELNQKYEAKEAKLYKRVKMEKAKFKANYERDTVFSQRRVVGLINRVKKINIFMFFVCIHGEMLLVCLASFNKI